MPRNSYDMRRHANHQGGKPHGEGRKQAERNQKEAGKNDGGKKGREERKRQVALRSPRWQTERDRPHADPSASASPNQGETMQ
jgi:hypothetical protein